MDINKRLLGKSMVASLLITVLLMAMAYLPIWAILTNAQRTSFPQYPFIISAIVIFLLLTGFFYFDIRGILERK